MKTKHISTNVSMFSANNIFIKEKRLSFLYICDVFQIIVVCFFPPAGENVCGLDKEAGPCYGYFVRWYYDVKNSRCDRFVYGGCQGNENNYLTLKECEQKCKAEVEHKGGQ